MKKETVILWIFDRKGICILLLLMGGILIGGCNKRSSPDYLQKAIKCDAILCVSIYTENSDTLFIYCLPEELEKEYASYGDKKKIEHFIYRHLQDSLPFKVSEAFYKDQSEHSYQIEKDSLMQLIYDEYGVAGLLRNYFKKRETDNDLYIFRNTRQRFVVKGEKPLPAFGQHQNLGYMCYLLSRHNIYMGFTSWDEILLVVIYSSCSDNVALENYEKESKQVPYRRDPYAE